MGNNCSVFLHKWRVEHSWHIWPVTPAEQPPRPTTTSQALFPSFGTLHNRSSSSTGPAWHCTLPYLACLGEFSFFLVVNKLMEAVRVWQVTHHSESCLLTTLFIFSFHLCYLPVKAACLESKIIFRIFCLTGLITKMECQIMCMYSTKKIAGQILEIQ